MLAGGGAREAFTGAVHFAGWRHAVTAVGQGLAVTSLVLAAGCGDWVLIVWHLGLWLHTGPQTEMTGPLRKQNVNFCCTLKPRQGNFFYFRVKCCVNGPYFHKLRQTKASDDKGTQYPDLFKSNHVPRATRDTQQAFQQLKWSCYTCTCVSMSTA